MLIKKFWETNFVKKMLKKNLKKNVNKIKKKKNFGKKL